MGATFIHSNSLRECCWPGSTETGGFAAAVRPSLAHTSIWGQSPPSPRCRPPPVRGSEKASLRPQGSSFFSLNRVSLGGSFRAQIAGEGSAGL